MSSWSSRLLLLLVWLALPAGVAFLVARNAADEPVADPSQPMARVDPLTRGLVSTEEQLITSIVSGDAVVVRDEAAGQWLLVAPVESNDLAYRLLDPPIDVRGLIRGGPAGFACAWAGLGQPGGGEVLPSAAGLDPANVAGVTMRCVIPPEVRVVAGLDGAMVLTMEPPVMAPALPVSAVIGGEGRGQVVVVGEDGETTIRDVTLGPSDGFRIAVTGGLAPGEQVFEVPT